MTNHSDVLFLSRLDSAIRDRRQKSVEHGNARFRHDLVPLGSVLLVSGLLTALLWVVYDLASDRWLTVPNRQSLALSLPEGRAELSLRRSATPQTATVVERRLNIDRIGMSGSVLLPPVPVTDGFWGTLRWHVNEGNDHNRGPWLELESSGENWLIDLSDLTIHRLFRIDGRICADPVYRRPGANKPASRATKCSGSKLDRGDMLDLTNVAARWSSKTLGRLDLRRGFLPDKVGARRAEWHSGNWLAQRRFDEVLQR